MSRLTLGVALVYGVLSSAPTVQADILFSESFETDGQGVRYTASDPFNVNQSDNGAYWDRGENADFNTIVPYTNPDGTFFWAAESVDWTSPGPGGNGNEVQTMDLGPIGIAGFTDIFFTGLFASTATALGPGFPFDQGEGVRVKYSVDGSPFQNGLCFAPEDWPDLRNLGYDTDCNGSGESGVLTDGFATFGFGIPDGTTLEIHIEVEAPGSSQEVAFDLLQVTGDPALLAGDANHDGQVTGADLISVQQNFGNVGAIPLQGDANNDGQVTGADLISVQQNFGNVLGPAGSNVPEPGTAGLIAVLVCAGSLKRPGLVR